MLMTCHVLAGAAIARLARRPAIACPLAVVSHLVLDATPHADAATLFTAPTGGLGPGGVPFVLADALIGTALVLLFSRGARDRGLLLTCAALAILTDLLNYAPVVGDWFEAAPLTGWWAQLHHRLQWNTGREGMVLGFATQALLVAACAVTLTKAPAPPPRG
jgi:hypothetical protein